MEQKDPIVFDVDGTLADSVGLFIELGGELLEELGAPPVPESRVRELMSQATPDLLLQMLPEDFPDAKAQVDQLMAQNMGRWRKRYHEETKPLPGALDVVRALKSKNYPLGIATSSGRELPFLSSWGIREDFVSIVGREDVERHKPHPECLLLSAKNLQVAPERCTYVGDSIVDIRAARAANMRAIAVSTGTASASSLEKEKPDALLENIKELLEQM
jgi:2-phosphoglycolate phosphatase